VMTAPIISISSDLSEESVSSHAPRVILFGVIPAIIHIISKVPIVPADPIVAPEDSLPPVPGYHWFHLLLYLRLEADSDPDPLSRDPEHSPSLLVHDDMVFERVGPIPTRRLAWRRASHHLSDCHSSPDSTSDSSTFGSYSDSSSDTSSGSSSYSLSGSSSVHSSGCDSSGQAHLEPSTRVASPRSSTASIPSSTHVSRSIAPTLADLLPPRKRCSEVEEECFEVEASAETEEIVVDPSAIEVPIDKITEIETAQRQLEAGQLIAGGEREREETMTITHSGMTPEAIEELVNRRVEEALTAYEKDLGFGGIWSPMLLTPLRLKVKAKMSVRWK
ncbi:hypothetical protein Tco_0484676, partial [Tanacetum coccineum]